MKITTFPGKFDAKNAKFGKAADVTLKQLHNLIFESDYSLIHFKDDTRVGENFISTDFIAIDMDDGLPYTIAMDRLAKLGYSYSLTFSKSHRKEKQGKPACDRYHIILPLADTVMDYNILLSTWENLRKEFPESDKVVKDKARFFYASVKHPVDSDILKTDGVPVPLSFPTKSKGRGRPSKAPSIKSQYPPFTLTPTIVKFIVEAPTGSLDGEFNHTLYGASKDLGAQGLDEDFIAEFLQNFAPDEFDHNDIATIRSAIKGCEDVEYKRHPKTGDLLPEGVQRFLEVHFKNKYVMLTDQAGVKATFARHKGNNEFEIVTIDTVMQDAGRMLHAYESHFLQEKGLKAAVQTWATLTDGMDITKIKPLATADDPSPCFKKLDFQLTDMETPLFDELMGRTEGAEQLMAFTWSLFEPDSYDQQYLYWMGEGGVGKSSYVNFLDHFLGNALVSLRSEGAGNDKFWNSQLIGARLGVFADTNHSSFMSSGLFKSVSGGDKLKMEYKGGKQFSMHIECKFMLLSNEIPQLGNESQDSRRLLLIRTQGLPAGTKRDSRYTERLLAEAPGWFYKCREVYRKVCGDHCEIPGDSTLKSVMEEFYLAEYHRIFNQHFTQGEVRDTIKHRDLHKEVGYELKRGNIKIDKFRKFMSSKYGIEFDETRKVYIGVKLK